MLWKLGDQAGGSSAPGAPEAVQPVRCFPWSERDRAVSLRGADGKERALIWDPAALDGASRAALERALSEGGLVLEIVRVMEVEEETEIRIWRVETRQGPRVFQTRDTDWPRKVPGGGLTVQDVAGDLYLIRDPSEMDATSRRLLWAFID
ncbi:MAG TPA: DUF1854 domain-containing protein [Bdellovibrionota bacterium]|jgi:hypothetical protein|nr:DUF1854 domain-containing protein [Bdellovibrionota bacterium]